MLPPWPIRGIKTLKDALVFYVVASLVMTLMIALSYGFVRLIVWLGWVG